MDNKTKKALMLGTVLLLCGLTSLLGNLFSRGEGKLQLLQEDKPVNSISENYSNKNRNDAYSKGYMIKVYVSGAVINPGIYELKNGARANDAVMAAGGMLDTADPQRVNLALKLKDGMQVNVPFIKNITTNYSNRNTNLVKKKEAIRGMNGIGTGLVNINTGSAKELEALPGIGPSMAQRIISYREKKPFSCIEDLLKVPGIGKAKLEMLKEKIRV